ncbi:hypothetical protein [Eubacterium aggregans]|uniref:hypothetical protein n=1 Tax=Eubacterium aggregans TaxID=81409 RepID=UPI003F321B76
MEENKCIVDEFMELVTIIMKEFDLTRPEAIEVAKAVMLKKTLEDLLGKDGYDSVLDRIAETLEDVATRV